MRMVRRWSGLWSSVFALGFIALTGPSASASTLFSYSTTGIIESTGVTGAPVISFVSLNGANTSFTSPSYFSLGEFQVASLPGSGTTTYVDTPFHITLVADTVNGVAPTPNETPIVLSGTLNGTISGGTQSTVTAQLDPISPINFQTGQFLNTLTVPNQNLILVPSTTNNGLTTIEAQLATIPNPVPIPEPTTIAMFVTTLAGFGLRGRLRARRAA